MDWEKREHLRKVLRPGLCLVRDPKYPEPFLVNVPFLPLDPNVNDDEVLDRLMALTETVYHHSEAAQIRDAIRRYRNIPADAIALLPAHTIDATTLTGSLKTKPVTSAKVNLKTASEGGDSLFAYPTSKPVAPKTTGAIKLIQFIIHLPNPFLTESEIFAMAGITSGSVKTKLKETSLNDGHINIWELQKAKTFLNIWEVTDAAYKMLGIEMPQYHSKGRYLHQFCAHRIQEWAKSRGFKVEMESFLANGKAIDLVLRKEGEQIWTELAMSDPMEKETKNLIRNLDNGIIPDKIIMACRDGKMTKKLSELLAATPQLEPFKDIIEIRLAGDMIDLKGE